MCRTSERSRKQSASSIRSPAAPYSFRTGTGNRQPVPASGGRTFCRRRASAARAVDQPPAHLPHCRADHGLERTPTTGRAEQPADHQATEDLGQPRKAGRSTRPRRPQDVRGVQGRRRGADHREQADRLPGGAGNEQTEAEHGQSRSGRVRDRATSLSGARRRATSASHRWAPSPLAGRTARSPKRRRAPPRQARAEQRSSWSPPSRATHRR